METLCILCCYCYQYRHPHHQHDNDNQSKTPPLKLEATCKTETVGVGDDNAIALLFENKYFEPFCQALATEHCDLISALENPCSVPKKISGGTGGGVGSSDSIHTTLAICPDCLASIGQAVGEKVKMDEVEVQVREMQRQLLVMLKKLQDCVDSYHQSMAKIDDIVRNSDISCLQSCIDGRNKKRAEAGEQGVGRKSRRNIKFENVKTQRNGVFMFRERISKVVKEMGIFKKDLSKRFAQEPLPPTPFTSEFVSSDADLLDEQDLQNESFEQASSEDPLKNEQVDYLAPLPPSPENLMDWCTVELELDKLEEEEKRDAAGIDEYQPSSDDNDYDAEEDNGSNFSDEEELKSPVKKTVKKKKKKKKPKPITSKKTKKSTTTTKTSKKTKTDYLHEIDTCSWSPFKQRFITKLLRRSENKRPSTKQDVDPTRDYPMTFDSSTGQLIVGGVQVLVMDEPETFSGYLRCSQCPHQTKPASNSTRDESVSFPNIVKAMVSHVLGHHLDVFRCPVCDKSLLSHWRYLEHLKGHQGKFTCDICGRPCATKDALAYHRWRHMSPEEQREALDNGIKDPKRYLEKDKEKPKTSHVCVTCGKGFQNRRLLKQHEDTHRTDREVVVCPQCGKQMLKHSYDVYHKNHGCSVHDDLQPNRVHCLECNVGFKNRQFLRKHMLRVHSKEALQRNFVCELCSKRFKDKGDLKVHMKIHAEEKLWKCSKGCGKDFSVKRYWRRHNLTCGRSGGVVAAAGGECQTEEVKIIRVPEAT